MNKVLGMKASKQIEQLIKERVQPVNAPYTFKVTGVTGYGYDLQTTALKSFEKIKDWAEREGAEVTLIQNKYAEIQDDSFAKKAPFANFFRTKQKGQSKGFLLVEITDPCARIIEHLTIKQSFAQVKG